MQNTNMYSSSTSSSSSPSSSLILLIIFSIQLVPFCLANNHKFLATFTCKSLVRIADAPPSKSATPTVNHQRVLEIEESYDETRQLGKLIALDQGERIELFTRGKDSLYLEARYRQDGSLAKCKTWNDRPDEGFFRLFRDMVKRSDGSCKEQSSHLIGPASLLFLFHEELSAMWLAKLQNNLNSTATEANSGVSQSARSKVSLFDRRQDNPAEKVQFSLGINSFTGANKVVNFKQSDFFIERSTELSELAEFATFTSGDDRLFIIDYLAIDQLDPSALPLDLFKLPSRFSCIAMSSSDNYEFNFEQVWPSKVPGEMGFSVGRSLSVIFHETEFHPEGVKLIVDTDRQVLRFDIDGHSENLVDLKRVIVYHMPTEASPNANSERVIPKGEQLTSSGLRNDECSILSMKNLLDDQNLSFGTNIWSILVGQTKLVAYLGKTRFVNGRAAHEFEIKYNSASDLPAFFKLLADLKGWQAAGTLVGKLWLSIESCSELYSAFVCNQNPRMLGFKLELINHDENGIIQIAESKLVQISEFQWEPFGLIDYGLSDIRRCPVEKVQLSSDVRWSSNDDERLDGFIHLQFRNFMKKSNIELNLAHIDRQLFPSTTMATYLVELLESPNQMIAYNLMEEKQLTKSDMKSSLISRTKRIKTLYDCLAWASLFKNAGAVLYSSKPAECLIFETAERTPLVERAKKEAAWTSGVRKTTTTTLYWLYASRVERPTYADKKEQSMDFFISQQLRELNKIMLNSQCKFKPDGANSETTVQFGPLRKLHEQTTGSSYSSQTTLLYKSGYRFLEKKLADEIENSASSSEQVYHDVRVREQVASISLAQCLNRCEASSLCASFSYCKYTDLEDGQYCQLADLKLSSSDKGYTTDTGASIEDQLTRDAGCEIHAKDYLQYYQPEGREMSSDQLGNNWHKDLNAKTLLDCASSCHTSAGFACLRFTFCQKEARCLLWLTVGPSSTEQPRTASVYVGQRDSPETSNVNQPNIAADSQADCALFRRKSITLYHRTLTTRSGALRWTGEGLVESRLEHVNKESCAERCQAEAECRSFDSCRIVSGTASSGLQASGIGNASPSRSVELQVGSPKTKNDRLVYHYDCVLLSSSVFDGSKMRLVEVAGNEQETESMATIDLDARKFKVLRQTQCTHYEHSAAKQDLSPQKLKLILQSLQTNIGKVSTGSYLTNLFGAALLGLAIGLSARFLVTIVKDKGGKPI